MLCGTDKNKWTEASQAAKQVRHIDKIKQGRDIIFKIYCVQYISRVFRSRNNSLPINKLRSEKSNLFMLQEKVIHDFIHYWSQVAGGLSFFCMKRRHLSFQVLMLIKSLVPAVVAGPGGEGQALGGDCYRAGKEKGAPVRQHFSSSWFMSDYSMIFLFFLEAIPFVLLLQSTSFPFL